MTRKITLIALIFFISLGAIPGEKPASGDALPEIMTGIRNRYGNAEALTADYTRDAISKTMALLESAERHDTAAGKLYFKAPDLLRLEQVSPQEELLLTDGQILWWYIPVKQEAYRYPAQRFGQELALLSNVFKGLKNSEDSFHISARKNSSLPLHHLILTPDPPWQDIDHLEIIIRKKDFAITQVDIYNTIGGLSRFTLTKWKEINELKKEFFRFSPPPQVRIIEK